MPDIGGKVRKYMKEKIKYKNEPMGKVRVVSDFLPSPEELVLKDETVKVTISLSKTSDCQKLFLRSRQPQGAFMSRQVV